MCHEPRRNSPSVTPFSPNSACICTARRMQSSSTSRKVPGVIQPSSHSLRAANRGGGRNRLPTCSARKGGEFGLFITASYRALQGDNDLAIILTERPSELKPGRFTGWVG